VDWIPIAERADTLGVLRGQLFSDCTIVGPAALVLLAEGNHVRDCDFMRPVRADPAGGPERATVYLFDCTFERCYFDSSISLLGRHEPDPR
jgi:hypothetical protein